MSKKLEVIPGGRLADPVKMPEDLGPHGTELWKRVMSEYAVEDAGGVAMLTAACRALDRAEDCRQRIDKEGVTIRGKTGSREHPLLKAELANRAFCIRTLQKLGLNFEPVRSPGYAV